MDTHLSARSRICLHKTRLHRSSVKGKTFLKCLIFFLYFAWKTSLLVYSLSSLQRFSIGLASGDSAGVHQWTPLSSKKARASVEVCLGSLSCKILLYQQDFNVRDNCELILSFNLLWLKARDMHRYSCKILSFVYLLYIILK